MQATSAFSRFEKNGVKIFLSNMYKIINCDVYKILTSADLKNSNICKTRYN